MSDNFSIGDSYKTIGMMDKAWEFKWAMRFIQIILFLDLAMAVSSPLGRGILGWNSGEATVLNNLGFVLITTLAFTIYAALLTPTFSRFANDIFNLIRLNNFFMLMANDQSKPPSGYVWIWEVRKDAFENGDPFWIERYDQMHIHAMRAFKDLRAIGDLLFGASFIAVVSFIAGTTYFDKHTLVSETIAYIPDWAAASISIPVVYFSLYAITYSWNALNPLWVEYPELYQKLNKPAKPAYLAGSQDFD